MAATNSQVAKRSRGDSGISATGFLSGPKELGCSLSNWITDLFLISKGCEPSRGLAWWNQSGSWNRRRENNKSFFRKSPGMGQAANERDAKSMIFASPCYRRRLQMARIQRVILKARAMRGASFGNQNKLTIPKHIPNVNHKETTKSSTLLL